MLFTSGLTPLTSKRGFPSMKITCGLSRVRTVVALPDSHSIAVVYGGFDDTVQGPRGSNAKACALTCGHAMGFSAPPEASVCASK